MTSRLGIISSHLTDVPLEKIRKWDRKNTSKQHITENDIN